LVFHHAPALGPPSLRIEIAVDEPAPGRKAPPDRALVEAFGAMAPPCEQGEALVLEPAGSERSAREEEDARLVEPNRPAPGGEGAFHQRHVEGVAAVVEPNHLVDVGRGGFGTGE